MLKKLTALSLSLLICVSLLPSQAGAMDVSENEPSIQAEEMEIQGFSNDADAGIAPCHVVNAVTPEPNPGIGGIIGGWDGRGDGGSFFGGAGMYNP